MSETAQLNNRDQSSYSRIYGHKYNEVKQIFLIQKTLSFSQKLYLRDALPFSTHMGTHKQRVLGNTPLLSCKFSDRFLKNCAQIQRETRIDNSLLKKLTKSYMTLPSAPSPTQKRKTLLHRTCYNKCMYDPDNHFAQRERRMEKAESLYTNQSF